MTVLSLLCECHLLFVESTPVQYMHNGKLKDNSIKCRPRGLTVSLAWIFTY